MIRRRPVLGILAGLLLTLVLLESGVRILDRIRGRPFDVDATRLAIQEQCKVLSSRAFLPGSDVAANGNDAVPGAVILQPYTGWEHRATHRVITDDIAYYRSPESKSVYDVCILGASVARDFSQYGAARLIHNLKQSSRLAGSELRIHNYGVGAYKQPQPAMFLTYLLALGLEPDAVIEIDGFNEAALGYANALSGAHPLYPQLAGWAKATSGLHPNWDLGERMHAVSVAQDRASSFANRFLATGLWRSDLLARLGLARIASLRRDYAESYGQLMNHLQNTPKDAELTGPPFDASQGAVVDSIITCWTSCSLEMHGTCLARGIEFLHVLQPALDDPAGRPPTEKERERARNKDAWTKGVRATYPGLREAARRLAERGVPLLDATGVFLGYDEDIYIDICHFRERGNELLADAIADAFLRSHR